jgi:mannose-6-phosphate isomerase-like protein (cupin superfamily)
MKGISDTSKDKVVLKPWGQETIFIPRNLKYTFKMLTIKKGCRISLQSHDEKRETFVLVSGEAFLTTGRSLKRLRTMEMEPFRGYTITTKTIHRITAGKSDAIIIEGSTAEIGTTIRYQDDYNRLDETPAVRKKRGRGWHVNC